MEKGKVIRVRVEMTNNSFQTAGAQVINFRLNGFVVHDFTVTDISPNRTTLHCETQELAFAFDGMGKKKNFDSNNEEDLKGPFGPYFQKILSKKYDIILDSNGKTVSIMTDTTTLLNPDEKLITITDMLKPMMQEVEVSTSGPGFFDVLPPGEASLNLPWSKSSEWKGEKSTTTFKLDTITDSTILVDLDIKGTCNSSSEKMGRVTKTSQSITGTGKMIVDRNTGLLKTKAYTTHSKGTTEAMGGTVPINGKVEVLVSVSQQ